MIKPPPPFSMTYTASLPELMLQLKCSIAISTYQAGKVVFISPKDENSFVQLPRNFEHAMAMGVSGNKLAIAARNEVVVLVRSSGLAPGYPNQPNTYDSLYVPRVTYYTGQIDLHGLAWGTEGLWAVNTSFSCLALIDDNYSFVPRWKPCFITELASEDRCHLNGVALKDGSPLYVTAMGTGDEYQSWRKTIPGGGVVIHVPDDEVVLKDLPMPHSPRLYDGKLYLLFSATGEIVRADPETGTYDIVNRLSGFVRGMSKHQDYLFIGLSRLRQNASTFKDLPIAKEATYSGIAVIHLPTGGLVGELRYQATVDEIFDVQVLPGLMRPGIINTESETHRLALTTPDSTFWAQKVDS
jgi:uncharacterized protein (TIGR03032 family)